MNKKITDTTGARDRRLHNLGRLFRPSSIAVVGGSQAEGAIRANRRAGFPGPIWAVNPNRAMLEGERCFARIEDLPYAPDAVLLALSPERSVEAVEGLSAIGAGGAVCMAGGFAELGAGGRVLQNRLRQAAGDMAVLGPNCMGVLNLFDGVAVWGSDNRMEATGERGAALISQSGAFAFGITNIERGFPLGYSISTGNQAVIDAGDCIDAVLEDDRVSAIGLYLEGLEGGNRLGGACWRALQKGVPVVALKGGQTPAGEAIAISHTGAMVVETDLWQAFARRFGIAEVSTPKALVEALKFLTVSGIPRGNRLSAVTFSGGLNGLIAAAAPARGLTLPQPSDEGRAALCAVMPDTVPIANPLDLNVPFSSASGISAENGESLAQGIANLARGVSDMITFFLDVPHRDDLALDAIWLPGLKHMGAVSRELDVPCAVAGILPEGLDLQLRQELINAGVTPLLGFADAMEALSVGAWLGQAQLRAAGRTAPRLLDAHPEGAGTQMLDEAASKALLRDYGLSVPESRSTTAEDAGPQAEEIGFPVALKVLSDTIAHKAKIGGVQLGLNSREAVDQGITDIRQALKGAPGAPSTEKFLVEQMVGAPAAEYIVGIKRHAALGLALMVGRGGIEVEAYRQYRALLLPLIEEDLAEELSGIGLVPGALGYDALCAAIRAIATFAQAYQDRLQTLDVNPIIVTRQGSAIAADALIIFSSCSETALCLQ